MVQGCNTEAMDKEIWFQWSLHWKLFFTEQLKIELVKMELWIAGFLKNLFTYPIWLKWNDTK